MAFTSSLVRQNVAGVLKQQIWSWVATGVTSGTIKTGLSSVDHVNLNNTTTENDGKAAPSGGDVAISSVTSGDAGTLEVWGV